MAQSVEQRIRNAWVASSILASSSNSLLRRKGALNNIYLDNASTTKIEKDVKKAMMPFFSNIYANESSVHSMGRQSNKHIEKARKIIADTINCNTNEIYFTSSGSESNSWAIIELAFANKGKGNKIITTQIEHDSIINSCKYLEKQGFEIVYLSVDKYGKVNISELEKEIDDKTIIVSVMMVNNEVGTVQNIKEISEIVHKHKAIFHSDAVQGFGMFEADVKNLGVDALSVSAHKIYGPKGAGFLYVKNGIQIDNLIFGGNQEYGKRGGTLNTMCIVGFGKATEIAYKERAKNYAKILELRSYFVSKLLQSFGNKIIINGHKSDFSPSILSVSFVDFDANILLIKLDQKNIEVSRGSACTAGSSVQSYVLKSMGLFTQLDNTIRFSFGKYTTKKQLDYVIKTLNEIKNCKE